MKPFFSLLMSLSVLAVLGSSTHAVRGAAPPPAYALPADITEFRTVAQAITTRVSLAAPPTSGQPAYLGVTVESQAGKLVVTGVAASSPAANAGVQIGDVLQSAAGKPIPDAAALGEMVRSRSPGQTVLLGLVRNGKTHDSEVTLAPVSRPLNPTRRAVLGVQTEKVTEGLRLASVTTGSAADKAQLKVGDVVLELDGEKMAGKSLEMVSLRQPGESVRLLVKRGETTLEVKAILGSEETRRGGRGGRGGQNWDTRRLGTFSKPIYRLAVITIEYPDVKHNPKVKTTDWETALFSAKTYTDKSPTGQKVYGSMNDYYQEISSGKLSVQGKAFAPVTVKGKRADYANNTNRELLTEALDKLLARDGNDALKDYDGIFFQYAGNRVTTRRGGLYWPHRASLSHKSKRWAYFICPEGGTNMASISVISHEFGHMLGLPDLYARPEVPGEEGLGVWCTMSVGHGQDGKPLHFSAWCKERMGWLNPAVIDPRTKQKLILATVKGSSRECYKVLLRPDGTEYLLLENRRKYGFDRDLPAEGLLIWRVVDGRPVLEESHGILGPAGPTSHLAAVPYPSRSNTAFTPYTTPSSKPRKDGGLPVYITNIRKLPDGRITFHIGYEYF
jgi:M6 family metalloprotease-like protein